MMTKTVVQPRHEGEAVQMSDGRYQTRVRLARVNAETLEDNVYRNANADMMTFVVGIAWNDTYISESTRPIYSTYTDRLYEFKRSQRVEAQGYGDEILSWVIVYAHSRQDVVKLYDTNNTNAISGKGWKNRNAHYTKLNKAS